MSPDDALQQARTHFVQGLAHVDAHRLADAERSFAAALELAPGRPSVLTNLGVVRVRLGRCAEAIAPLEQASAAEQGNVDAWGYLGSARAELGQLEPALAAFDRALALQPALADLWSQRGSVLRELGRLGDAAESFERAIALGLDDPLQRHFLAAVRPGAAAPAPAAPPRAYVENLFDSYAGQFQSHLVAGLRYQAPEVLLRGVDALEPPLPTPVDSALDLGCGTGLLGPLLAPRARRIDGVDLSAGMLERARATGAYYALVHADVLEYLQAAQRHDQLVLAADVFIYLGALDAVFAGVARILASGGVFAFSAEPLAGGTAQDWALQPSLRYAHAPAYLERLAAAHGFVDCHWQRAPLREERGRVVDGLYGWLRRP